jgi:hypothetical protein
LRLLPLVLMEAVAFFLVIGETYLFFIVIVPLGSIPHNLTDYTAEVLFKLALTFGLGILWFLVMLAMTRFYIRSKVGRQTPSASS